MTPTRKPPGATRYQEETGMTERKPLWQRASVEVFALVIEPEIDALFGRPVDKHRAQLTVPAGNGRNPGIPEVPLP